MVDHEVDGQHVFSIHCFFDMFDGWWMVKPVRVVLGRSWGLCVRSRAALGAYVGGLGALVGPMLAILSLYGRSWAALGASVGGLGCTWLALGAYVGNLGPLLGLYWRSWVALGAYVGGLGSVLRGMWAV